MGVIFLYFIVGFDSDIVISLNRKIFILRWTVYTEVIIAKSAVIAKSDFFANLLLWKAKGWVIFELYS